MGGIVAMFIEKVGSRMVGRMCINLEATTKIHENKIPKGVLDKLREARKKQQWRDNCHFH